MQFMSSLLAQITNMCISGNYKMIALNNLE